MYVYSADTWCDSCGERLRREIAAEGLAPADRDDIYVDSDSWPQSALEESTDYPDHCAAGGDCLEAVDLFPYWHGPLVLHGAEATHVGAILSDGLTDDGVEYLKEMLDEVERTPYQEALHALWRETFADEL